MTGPTVQQDLVSILMRFRTFGYVFAVDIVKMYRQVLVHDSQIQLQRVLWRDDSSSPVRTYELTVTYGTRSVLFLATRAIKDLVQKWASRYPAGTRCALRDFYVDDLLTGVNSLAEARRIRDEGGIAGAGAVRVEQVVVQLSGAATVRCRFGPAGALDRGVRI